MLLSQTEWSDVSSLTLLSTQTATIADLMFYLPSTKATLSFPMATVFSEENLRYFFLCTWISRSMTCVFLDLCFMVQGCSNPGYLFLWTFYNLQSCSPTYWYNSSKVLPRFHNRYFFYRCTGAKFEKKTGKWDFSDFDDGDRGNGPASKWHSHHQLHLSTHPPTIQSTKVHCNYIALLLNPSFIVSFCSLGTGEGKRLKAIFTEYYSALSDQPTSYNSVKEQRYSVAES